MHRKHFIVGKRVLRRNVWMQIAVLIGIWFLGQEISTILKIPISGGVIGLLMVLGLLIVRKIRPSNLERGSEWLLAEMLLFFVPAVPAVLSHREFVGATGLKILAIILLGTVIVMVGTGLVVDACYHRFEKRPEDEA
ncbi:MAG: CidA/LrgA family protein [Fimbriimonas sp.]|nr:CidA/LrgA family protein [Fimbriimonas sp.]